MKTNIIFIFLDYLPISMLKTNYYNNFSINIFLQFYNLNKYFYIIFIG